jgi:hypothetical protein
MNDLNDYLEEIWDALLSRDVLRIRSTFNRLTAEEQRAVLTHLKHMENEPGWHREQRISAHAAVEALSPDSKQV